MLFITGQHWRLEGICASSYDHPPEAWDEGNIESKQLCKGCPVMSECLSYALKNNEKYGIWGGMTPKERRKLRRQLNKFLSKIERQKKALSRDDAGHPIAS